MTRGWSVTRSDEPLARALALEVEVPAVRRAVLRRVTRPTLVLGSTQPDGVVDVAVAEAAGVDVVRRHSGGGAVLLDVGTIVWIDVVLPAGDPLWHEDVGASFAWLGETWAAALRSRGVAATVHDTAPPRSALARLVCFAAIGRGEVSVDRRKVVGLAQRRTRQWSVFQGAALLAWEPERLLDLLNLADDQRVRAAESLSEVATGLPLAATDVEEAFLAQLPSAQ
jgi:lipoate---protein ligase